MRINIGWEEGYGKFPVLRTALPEMGDLHSRRMNCFNPSWYGGTSVTFHYTLTDLVLFKRKLNQIFRPTTNKGFGYFFIVSEFH